MTRYPTVLRRGHPAANNSGHVREHVIVAEDALGQRLPKGAAVHHVNGDITDNRPSNLVICQDHGYHMLIHKRQRAMDECGHADWYQCRFCRQWGPSESMWVHPRRGGMAHHTACQNKYRNEWRYRTGRRGARNASHGGGQ